MRVLSEEQRTYLREVACQLQGASRGRKGEILDRASRFMGCSRDAVYRGLRQIGWTSGRRRRADHGGSRVSPDDAAQVANIVVESTRNNGKRLLSIADAIEIAHANGRIQASASPITYARVMREHGIHPRQLEQPSPHVRMRSKHPNHVWQFDVSVCVLFYLKSGGLAVMEEKEFYKNKPQNLKRIENQRVLRYLMTDHYSGTFYVEYFLAAGEDQETLFRFLMSSFSERPNESDPFHGVPYMMIWDAGSANQSYMIRNLLDRLQVQHIAHEPGNPRAKGQVEKTHDLVERSFEGRLYMLSINSIEELNEKAHLWMRHYNGKRKHSRTGHTRYGLWQRIREEQLRICPPVDLCRELLRTKPESRKVSAALTISYAVKGFGSAEYSVEHVPGVRVGDAVNVIVNPYRAPSVFVVELDHHGQEQLFECDSIPMNEAGFPSNAPVYGESFKQAPDTGTYKERKRMAKDAYGVETNREVEKARAKRKPAFNGQIDPLSYLEGTPLPSYMRRKGIAIDLPNAAPVSKQVSLSHIEALKRIRSRLGRALEPQENKAIRDAYPDGIPEEVLDELIVWLSGAGAVIDREGISGTAKA